MTDHEIPEGTDNSPAGNGPGFPWSVTPPAPGQDSGAPGSENPTEPLNVTGAAYPAEQPNLTEPLPPLPPFGRAADPVTAPRSRGLAAGVLVGALLLGGAAGVGGAAGFNAWDDDANSSSSAAPSSAGSVRATNAADLPDGSVEKVAAAVLPSVVKINVTGQSGSGSGSGVVLKADGTILTNNHVVSVAGSNGTITVNLNDGRTVKATVLGTDPVTDMAVIKADATGLTPADIGKSADLQVGQSVVAVGSPYGLNATVTTGIVSALNRPVSVQTEDDSQGTNPFGQQTPQTSGSSTTYPAIQTDAAINPGNSGGPLVNLAGQVVGINSSIRTGGSADSGGSIGLGFSIPIDEVLPIVNQIIDGQDPTHARLAITVSDVASSTLAQGALVRSVEKNGPADEAGLKEGDVITKVNEDLIDGSESLIATIRGHRPDEEVTLTYLRDGKTQTTTAKLGSDADTSTS
ncbi:MAG: trypsin-like peptidase domain-containing protein [Propionibacteriales bacterium]|nr:trypsin-like peptidase domain-containing protein [Propionibacteriales bacterium]